MRKSFEVLLALDWFDELEALVERARKASPMDGHHILGLALLREKQLRFDEAAQLWKSLRKRWPCEILGYLGGARCLCHLNRQRKAVTVLGRYQVFP